MGRLRRGRMESLMIATHITPEPPNAQCKSLSKPLRLYLSARQTRYYRSLSRLTQLARLRVQFHFTRPLLDLHHLVYIADAYHSVRIEFHANFDFHEPRYLVPCSLPRLGARTTAKHWNMIGKPQTGSCIRVTEFERQRLDPKISARKGGKGH